MIGDGHSLTPGYIARHVPPGSRVGREIAVLDIAQDFLLAHLHTQGVFDNLVVFKGGTALRKLFAGAAGRFSTDIDFAATEPGVDRREVAELVAREANVTLGPFRFQSVDSRGRWQVRVTSPLGSPHVSMKLDVGPPCWLQPDVREFVATPTQARYGFRLPRLPSMHLEEVLAEKVARLSRTSTARDASDLIWAATTTPHSRFSRERVRRLAILKVWVDNHGLRPGWDSALAPRAYDAEWWLSPRGVWDDEQIGLLAHPPPTIGQLGADLVRYYAWLRDLSSEEARWAEADLDHRGDIITAIKSLDGSALRDTHLW